MKSVKIYQINATRECPYSFMSWDYAVDKFNMEDYRKVAEFDYPFSIDDNKILDEIWCLGNNGELQSRFPGMYSVSVSNIIEIDDHKYYVDSFGFKEVQ